MPLVVTLLDTHTHICNYNFLVLPFPDTSPVKEKGKANSTIWQHGKDLTDYSYAAGYSTIKELKSRHESATVERIYASDML